MSSILYSEDFSVNPQDDPIIHGTISGDNTSQNWDASEQTVNLQPGMRWRSPAFTVDPLSYVRLSFKARLTTTTLATTSQQYNRNNISFISINPLATWNLDPANSGPSGGDLIADDYTSLVDIGETWGEQVFYSRSQANASQMSIQIGATEAGLIIDNIKIETVDTIEEVASWSDELWSRRAHDSGLSISPAVTSASSTEQYQRLKRTIDSLQSGRPINIVLVGDSIVNDLANSAFETLLNRHFPESTIKVITAVGGGTGMDQWNPQNDTYPFVNSKSYRNSLNFNDGVIEQEPDLIILGGISTPASQAGYSAFQEIINKIRSSSVANRLGYEPDILIASGAFGIEQNNWYPSDQLNALGQDYRSNLLNIANQNNIAFLDLAGIWGSYLLAASNSADTAAFKSPDFMDAYWRDSIHANSFGKSILGRGLVEYLRVSATLSGENLPAVSLSIESEKINEDADSELVYVFSRTGSTSGDLEVFYTIGGTAQAGKDYEGLTEMSTIRSIQFAAGAATARITVKPIADTTFEFDETVLVALDSTSGIGYTIVSDAPVAGYIVNDDPAPYVEAITAIMDNTGTIQGSIANGGATNDTTPTLTGTLSAPLAAGESLTIYSNGSAIGKATVNASTLTWSFTTTLTSNGLYSFTARVVDAAGNQGKPSSPYAIKLDASSFDGNPWRYDWTKASTLNGTPGLLKASLQVSSPRTDEPAFNITALRVDLDTPGLSLINTTPINDWQPNTYETITQTTRDFINSKHQQFTPVVAAINTSFFNPLNSF